MIVRSLKIIASIVVALVESPLASAQEADLGPPPYPLVVIPGIAGSELWEGQERVWGGLSGLRRFERLKVAGGPSSFEPLPNCSPDERQFEELGRCGLLKDFQIIGPIAVGQYSILTSDLQKMGYSFDGPDQNLFFFPYDFRQSNFDIAAEFARFVDKTPGLSGQKFDVLAHSMGGLVALLYAQDFDAPEEDSNCGTNKCRIQTVITLGTPYHGSMNSVATPVLGWGWLSRRIAGGSQTIAATLLSWPSFYELLPSSADCCRDENGTFDVLTVEGFLRLPYGAGSDSPKLTSIDWALERRRELHRRVEAGWPMHLWRRSSQCEPARDTDRVYLIAGDHHETRRSLTVTKREMSFSTRRGDGTVLRNSAAMRDLARAWESFAEHPTIFDDRAVRSRLEAILFRCAIAGVDVNVTRPVIDVRRPFDAPKPADVVTIAAEIEQLIGEKGSTELRAIARLEIKAARDIDDPVAKFHVDVDGVRVAAGDLHVTNRRIDGGNILFSFASHRVPVFGEGVVILSVTFEDGPSVRGRAVLLQ